MDAGTPWTCACVSATLHINLTCRQYSHIADLKLVLLPPAGQNIFLFCICINLIFFGIIWEASSVAQTLLEAQTWETGAPPSNLYCLA